MLVTRRLVTNVQQCKVHLDMSSRAQLRWMGTDVSSGRTSGLHAGHEHDADLRPQPREWQAPPGGVAHLQAQGGLDA